MAYNAKTDWQDRDPFTSASVNKIEQGIADAHSMLAQFNAAISNLQNRVNVIESTLPESYTDNVFYEDLSSLQSIKVFRGRWNQVETRLEV